MERQFDDMTIAELRELAEQRGVSLRGLRLKGDIVAAIRAAERPARPTPAESPRPTRRQPPSPAAPKTPPPPRPATPSRPRTPPRPASPPRPRTPPRVAPELAPQTPEERLLAARWSDALRVCRTEPALAEICERDDLWRRKFGRDFEEDLPSARALYVRRHIEERWNPDLLATGRLLPLLRPLQPGDSPRTAQRYGGFAPLSFVARELLADPGAVAARLASPAPDEPMLLPGFFLSILMGAETEYAPVGNVASRVGLAGREYYDAAETLRLVADQIRQMAGRRRRSTFYDAFGFRGVRYSYNARTEVMDVEFVFTLTEEAAREIEREEAEIEAEGEEDEGGEEAEFDVGAEETEGEEEEPPEEDDEDVYVPSEESEAEESESEGETEAESEAEEESLEEGEEDEDEDEDEEEGEEEGEEDEDDEEEDEDADAD